MGPALFSAGHCRFGGRVASRTELERQRSPLRNRAMILERASPCGILFCLIQLLMTLALRAVATGQGYCSQYMHIHQDRRAAGRREEGQQRRFDRQTDAWQAPTRRRPEWKQRDDGRHRALGPTRQDALVPIQNLTTRRQGRAGTVQEASRALKDRPTPHGSDLHF